jgi:hypothetical protein
MLEVWALEEVRSVVVFLCTRRNYSVEIHHRLTEVCGDGVMSAQHARKWCTQLENDKIFMTMIASVDLEHTEECESSKRRGTDFGKPTSRNSKLICCIGVGTVHSRVL